MILEKINELCREKGISIAALERELGIGNGTIRRWDVVSPRFDKLLAVADYFKVTVDDLVRQEVRR